MVSAPILAFPEFGREAEPFILDVDASGSGLGVVLSQKQNGQERVIAYASRLLQPAESRYPVTKRELLAATWAMCHMQCYLLGKPFVVRSDYKALEHRQNYKDPPAQIARWLQFLAEYDFTLLYRPGARHANADGLSRTGAVLAVDLAPPTTADDDLAKLQREDPDLIIIGEWITQHSRPERPPVGASPVLAHLCRIFSSLELGDGLLCCRWHDPDPSRPSFLQVVVPFGHRAFILTKYHDECGHMGEEKTLRLRSRFHWYGKRRDVVDWVRLCLSCSAHKTPKHRGRGAPLVSTWSVICGSEWQWT